MVWYLLGKHATQSTGDKLGEGADVMDVAATFDTGHKAFRSLV